MLYVNGDAGLDVDGFEETFGAGFGDAGFEGTSLGDAGFEGTSNGETGFDRSESLIPLALDGCETSSMVCLLLSTA
jgi:hypothetical protein